MLRNLWRFDPCTDLHGITIYGTQLKKDTGVAVIRAKVDQKLLLDMVKITPEHEVSTYGKYELHSWLKDGKKRENAAFFQAGRDRVRRLGRRTEGRARRARRHKAELRRQERRR